MLNNQVKLSNSFAYACPGITRGTIRDFNVETLRTFQPRIKSSDDIINDVCDYYNIPVSKIKSKTRGKQDIALARQLSMALIRKRTPLSYPKIAELFGRNHSTVMHAECSIADILSLPHSAEKDDINIFLKQYGYTL